MYDGYVWELTCDDETSKFKTKMGCTYDTKISYRLARPRPRLQDQDCRLKFKTKTKLFEMRTETKTAILGLEAGFEAGDWSPDDGHDLKTMVMDLRLCPSYTICNALIQF